jgi:prepilin-type N-terminal cleavage/methylation domain-containing protein
MRRAKNSSRGFTLVELMISAALGAVLMVVATQLYSRGIKAAWVTSQRAEMQQDFRAAANLLQRDISMAGAGALGQQGLATSAVGLPTGAGSVVPVYPCDGLTTCNYINGAPVAYPTSSGAPFVYSIIPGPNLGITVNAAQGPTDIITVIYADVNLALNCYVGSMNAAGTVVTFQLPTVIPGTCITQPAGTPPASLIYSNPGNPTGLQVGDLILFGSNAVGVVTNPVTPCAPNPAATYSACYTVDFTAADPGHINQPAAASGSLKQFASAATPSAVRLMAITYYLDISPTDGVTPRLMRIQNGRPPAPVAENIVYLKFSYDVYNGGVVTANQSTLPAGTNPGMITKVNIVHMSIRSQQSTYNGYQGLDLQTSISARNLTSQQEYPISGSSY